MTITFKPALAAAALTLSLSGAAYAEDVILRYLANHGGVAAHALAQESGYFDGTGLSVERVGYASGGPESLFALASRSSPASSRSAAKTPKSPSSSPDTVCARTVWRSNGISSSGSTFLCAKARLPKGN